MTWLSFGLGYIIGMCVGIAVTAFCVAARESRDYDKGMPE